MLSNDLVSFGLMDDWVATSALLDEKPSQSVLDAFTHKVKTTILHQDEESNRRALFSISENSEIRPWRHGVHPAVAATKAKFGYMFLRNSLKHPGILHGRDQDKEDDCPHCGRPEGFTPAHLLTCPTLGPSQDQGILLDSSVARWNTHDPHTLSLLLSSLQQRYNATFRHNVQSSTPGTTDSEQ